MLVSGKPTAWSQKPGADNKTVKQRDSGTAGRQKPGADSFYLLSSIFYFLTSIFYPLSSM